MNAAAAAHSRLMIILSFAAIYFIWGSTYLGNQLALESFPPFALGGTRFILSGLLLFAWCRFKGIAMPTAANWKAAAITGTLLIVTGTGTVIWAQQYVPSGLTALLIATVPLLIALVDWLRPNGLRPSLITSISVLVGGAAVAFMISPNKLANLNPLDHFGPMLLILGCCVSWSIGSVATRYLPMPQYKIQGAGMQMMVGGTVLSVLGLFVHGPAAFTPSVITTKALLAMLFLITFGAIAFAAYNYLLTATTPSKTATYAFVNPVIAMILGALIAGETMSARMIVCSVIILGAVAMTVLSGKPKAEVQPAPNLETANGSIRTQAALQTEKE